MKPIPARTNDDPVDALLKRAIRRTSDARVRDWLQRLLGGQYAASSGGASTEAGEPANDAESPQSVAGGNAFSISKGRT
jgi:hypothetical protein